MVEHPPQEFLLAELMCAKFCHDLAGPIGALNNGLEFLTEEDSPDMQKQAVELLRLSAGEATARLQTYRVAYGVVNHEGESNLDELRAMLEQYFHYGNVNFSWEGDSATPGSVTVNHTIRQLAVNMVLMASAALVYGGNLTVRVVKQAQGKHVQVKGEGTKIKFDPELEMILKGRIGVEEATTRNVQAFFLKSLAGSLDADLQFRVSPASIEFSADYRRK